MLDAVSLEYLDIWDREIAAAICLQSGDARGWLSPVVIGPLLQIEVSTLSITSCARVQMREPC